MCTRQYASLMKHLMTMARAEATARAWGKAGLSLRLRESRGTFLQSSTASSMPESASTPAKLHRVLVSTCAAAAGRHEGAASRNHSTALLW